MNEEEVIQHLKVRYPGLPLHIYLAHLNIMAGTYGLHIASQEDLLLKIDDVVVARLYYDATEKHYVVAEQETDNEKPVQYRCYMCPNLVTQETRWLPHLDMGDPINNLVFCSEECAHKALQVFLKNIDEDKQ